MATFNLTELRKKFGRIETFVGKLARFDPFTLKNGKMFYANTILAVGSNGKEVMRFTPRTDAEVTKTIQWLRNGAMVSNSLYVGTQTDTKSFIPVSSLLITGEFGYQGKGYSGVSEDQIVKVARRSLATAIATNRGPITLLVDNVRVYDICDVIGGSSKNQMSRSDLEFIDRYGRSVVYLGDEKRKITESESYEILSQSKTLRELIKDLNRLHENGLEGGNSYYRKLDSDDKISVFKFLYGLGYDGSKNYSPFNVSMTHKGNFSITKATSNSYRLQGDILTNGDMVYGSEAPVIVVDYSPGSKDFGVQNAKILIDRLDGRGNKQI